MTNSPSPPEITFKSEKDRFLGAFAQILYETHPEKPPTLEEIKETWRLLKKETSRNLSDSKREVFNAHGQVGKETYKRARDGYNRANNKMMGFISKLERSEPHELDNRLNIFWTHFIKNTGQLYKEVPGKVIEPPDFNQITDLALTGSEQPIRNLETAFERGKFKNTDISDNPIADISGAVGGEFINLAAELMPLKGENGEIVLEVAKTLGSPLSNLGPKVQQTFAAVLHIWLMRRRKDSKNKITIHINELAEMLGYERKDSGTHQKRVLDTIRECILTLERTRLTFAVPRPTVRKKIVQSSEPAITVTYHAEDLPPRGRVENHWKAISVTLNSFIEITSDKGFIKGSDFKKLNKLDSVHQRAELLLGKYLEHEWRVNWNKSPGVVTRKIATLLDHGLGLDVDIYHIERPRKVIEKLESALEQLQDLGTIKYFEYEPAYSDLLSKPRITQPVLLKLFDIRVHIEAGNQYKAHYKNFALTYEGAKPLPEIAAELKEYLNGSNTSQAVAAQDLSISKATINHYLSGKRAPSKKNAEKIRTYLDNKGKSLNLELL